ncbi:unnamed protein product [Victoria cruziana]
MEENSLQEEYQSLALWSVIPACRKPSLSTTTSHQVWMSIKCSLKVVLQPMRIVKYSVMMETNRYGTYIFQFPFMDGYNYRNGYQKESFCKATLQKSPASACNIQGVNTTREMYIRSKQCNSCILSVKPLNYRPPTTGLSVGMNA